MVIPPSHWREIEAQGGQGRQSLEHRARGRLCTQCRDSKVYRLLDATELSVSPRAPGQEPILFSHRVEYILHRGSDICRQVFLASLECCHVKAHTQIAQPIDPALGEAGRVRNFEPGCYETEA